PRHRDSRVQQDRTARKDSYAIFSSLTYPALNPFDFNLFTKHYCEPDTSPLEVLHAIALQFKLTLQSCRIKWQILSKRWIILCSGECHADGRTVAANQCRDRNSLWGRPYAGEKFTFTVGNGRGGCGLQDAHGVPLSKTGMRLRFQTLSVERYFRGDCPIIFV